MTAGKANESHETINPRTEPVPELIAASRTHISQHRTRFRTQTSEPYADTTAQAGKLGN
jgi:hypothetical protein